MSGQINRGTRTGDFIYNYCLGSDVTTIVEIGTWNGQGSTKCIAEAILSRPDDSNLISLENNLKMHNEAVKYWEEKLLNFNSIYKDKIKLLYGSVITPKDLIPLEELRKYKDYVYDWERWYREGTEDIKNAPNVLEQTPEEIDVLLLDGGEFSTLAEFNILKDRAKCILLDDTSVAKCREISQRLLKDKDYKLIFIEENDGRNGFMGFVKQQ